MTKNVDILSKWFSQSILSISERNKVNLRFAMQQNGNLKVIFALLLLMTVWLSPLKISAEGAGRESGKESSYQESCYDYGYNPEPDKSCSNATLFFDFLYLKSYTGTYQAFYSDATSQRGASLLQNNLDWDYGFKMGIQKGLGSLPFGLELSWLHYRTENTASYPLRGNSGTSLESAVVLETEVALIQLIPTGDGFEAYGVSSVIFESRLHYNQVTLEMYKEVQTGPYFSLETTLGLEFVDLITSSNSTLSNVSSLSLELLPTIGEDSGGFQFVEESARTHIRGVGPSFSLTSGFDLPCDFKLMGGVKGALIWSKSNFVSELDVDGAGFGNDQARSLVFENSRSIGNRGFYTHSYHILRPQLLFHLNLAWMNQITPYGTTISLHAGWQGLFLFGSEETAYNFAYGRTFNLQGFSFGANLIF